MIDDYEDDYFDDEDYDNDDRLSCGCCACCGCDCYEFCDECGEVDFECQCFTIGLVIPAELNCECRACAM
jgi:hypothetical protein